MSRNEELGRHVRSNVRKAPGALFCALLSILSLSLLAGCGGGGGGGGGAQGNGGGGNPQQSTVTGTLTSQVTGQPLYQVTVSVQGTALSAVTDSNGNFSIANVPTGQQTLAFAVGGNQEATAAETIAGANDNLGTITLNMEGNPPPPPGV